MMSADSCSVGKEIHINLFCILFLNEVTISYHVNGWGCELYLWLLCWCN